jgi:hypothetical protein
MNSLKFKAPRGRALLDLDTMSCEIECVVTLKFNYRELRLMHL